MATITLRKSKFDNIKNVLDKLGANFKNYQSSLNELKHTAEGVDSTACNLTDTINDIASSSESEKDKVEKIQQLNRKIENFVNTAVQKEKSAKEEIVRKKNDFYKKYKNLKPECEKSYIQRACEKGIEIVRAINSWIEEHLDIIITALIVLAAVVICIFCPAAVIAIIGIIAGALSAIMGMADMVCMTVNNGKGIAETLAENGHGTLSKIWSGTSNGLGLASIIFPVGFGIKTIKTVGKMTFIEASKSMLKENIKEIPKNIKQGFVGFKNACKNNGIFKTLGTTTWKSFKSVTGIDDIENLWNIGKINGNSVLNGRTPNNIINNKNDMHWNIDINNMKMFPKTSKATDAIDAANKRLGTNYDFVPLTDKNGYIDVDWDAISIKTLGKEDGFNMKNLGLSGTKDNYDNKLMRFLDTGNNKRFKQDLISEIYGNKNSKVQEALNKNFDRTKTIINLTDITFHENFDLIHENLVPKQLHELIGHNGGREHIIQEILKIKYIDKLFARQTIIGVSSVTMNAIEN